MGEHSEISAKALMMQTFLQTASNMVLFRYHILPDKTLENPDNTSYYDEDFFKILKHYDIDHCGGLNHITIINCLTRFL